MKFSGRTSPLTPRVARNFRIAFLAVAAIISCVSLFFIVMGTLNWVRACRSADWPSTLGTVMHSEVDSSLGGRRRAGRSYSADIGYRYGVDGTTHDGTRVSFRVVSESKSTAQDIAQRYPVGKQVTVYFNPSDPSDSVLERGWGWDNAIPIAAGVFGVGFCAVFAWLTVRFTARAMAVP